MDSITIVRIRDDFTSITQVKKTKKGYKFSAPKHFTQSYEITQYLKSKKKIYLLINNDNILEESITLPAIIKNEATIASTLTAKLHDNGTTAEKLILNRLYTTLDATEESAVHRYEGLYEKEVLQAIAPIANPEFIQRITTERYALFALAEHTFKGKSYLCVYTEENKNLFVAVDKGVLLFSRIGLIQVEDETERIMEQISDINRTVAYAHQQYREARFEFIAIGGSIADGEILPMQLHASTGLNIVALAPKLIVDGLEGKHAQDSILEIGMLFLDKNMNFLTDSVKAAREFYLGTILVMLFAFLFMLFGLFQSYDAYSSYQSSLDEYNTEETRLAQTLRHTKTLTDLQIQAITSQLKSSTPLHHHLIDDLILFDDVLKLIKPHEVSFSEGNDLILDFKQQFKTLEELYLFEKNFRNKVSMITDKPIVDSYKTDYNTLTFESSLKMGGDVQPDQAGVTP